jgi:signal peptidase I
MSTTVKGDSMAPTIKDGQLVFEDTGAFTSAGPKRGDVVVFKRDGKLRILRVVGLPGEVVAIAAGKVSVNASALSEPYLASGTTTDSQSPSYQVPAGSYFMLADNRARDGDSRGNLGFVTRSELVGRVQV